MIQLRLSKQHIINIIFLALLTLFTASFLWSSYLQKENENNIDTFYRSTSWYSNRILYQSETFLYQARLYQLNGVELAELSQSYDLLWNRLDIFLESDETEILRANHPDVEQAVANLFNTIKTMDEDLIHPEQLQKAAFQQKILQAKADLLVLNYALSQVLSGTISQGVRSNNDLMQFWQLIMFIISLLLATALLRTTQRSSNLAKQDPLTKLGNRRALDQYLQQKLSKNHPISVAAIDLKRFKLINDEIGYHVGDRVLISFAEKLSQYKDAVAFRLGGDEFVLVGPYSGDLETLKAWGQKIKQQLSFDFQSRERSFPVSIRLGIAFSDTQNQLNAEELLAQAIQSLNETKQPTASDCVLYPETISRYNNNRMRLQQITHWLEDDNRLSPLNINLEPLYRQPDNQPEVMLLSLTWRQDKSICSLDWLAEQRLYLQVLPKVLEQSCQQTSLPVLLKLKTPHQIGQLLQTKVYDLQQQQKVLFGLPSLVGVTIHQINLLQQHQIKIALERINSGEEPNYKALEQICYWVPKGLPDSEQKKEALFQLANAFNQVTLLPLALAELSK